MKAYSIPTFIKEFRLSLGLTPAQFSELLGVSRQAVADAESGRYKTSRSVLSRILPRLGQDQRERLKDIIAEDYLKALSEN